MLPTFSRQAGTNLNASFCRLQIGSTLPEDSCTAVADRSGHRFRLHLSFQSGVALRWPPQSKSGSGRNLAEAGVFSVAWTLATLFQPFPDRFFTEFILGFPRLSPRFTAP